MCCGVRRGVWLMGMRPNAGHEPRAGANGAPSFSRAAARLNNLALARTEDVDVLNRSKRPFLHEEIMLLALRYEKGTV